MKKLTYIISALAFMLLVLPLLASAATLKSKVSGPKSLQANEEGSWTVTVLKPNQQNFSYYVKWGDSKEGLKLYEKNSTSNSFFISDSSATFTHSYSKAGNYKPLFIVANSDEQTVEKVMKVSVKKSSSSMDSVVKIRPAKEKVVGKNIPKITVASSKITNRQSTYSPGQTINFSVKGIASDGKVGLPSQDFHVQAWMEDNEGTVKVDGVYQSVNATYNYNTSLWDVIMTAPSDRSQTYKIETAFYCSQDPSPYCANGQINKSFNFKLNSVSKR